MIDYTSIIMYIFYFSFLLVIKYYYLGLKLSKNCNTIFTRLCNMLDSSDVNSKCVVSGKVKI